MDKPFEQLMEENGYITINWYRAITTEDMKFGVEGLHDIPKGTFGWFGNGEFMPDDNDKYGRGVISDVIKRVQPIEMRAYTYKPSNPANYTKAEKDRES